MVQNRSSRKRKAENEEEDVVGAAVKMSPRVSSFDQSSWWMVDLHSADAVKQGATPLIRRCMRSHGWTETYARRVLAGYRQFLFLKTKVEDWNAEILSPSVDVDRMWHEHILDVVNYVHDCMLLCGHVVGHDPDGSAPENEAARNERRQTTADLLDQCEGELVGEIDRDGVWKEVFHRQEPPPPVADAIDDVEQIDPPPRRSTTENDSIVISVRDQTGEKTYFRIERSTILGAVFIAYARRKGVEVRRLRFMLNGVKIEPRETPESLDLDDQGMIDCLLESTGC